MSRVVRMAEDDKISPEREVVHIQIIEEGIKLSLKSCIQAEFCNTLRKMLRGFFLYLSLMLLLAAIFNLTCIGLTDEMDFLLTKILYLFLMHSWSRRYSIGSGKYCTDSQHSWRFINTAAVYGTPLIPRN